MDRLDKDCLISIFNHLDLRSRFHASKTCKIWRELLQNSEAVDSICEVNLEGRDFPEPPPFGESEETPEWSSTHALAAVFTHISTSDQLNLPAEAARILFQLPIRRRVSRFGKINFVWSSLACDTDMECLWFLPITVTSLSLSILTNVTDFDLSDFDHLERLEIEIGRSPYIPLWLPSTLRALSINWADLDLDSMLDSRDLGCWGRLTSAVSLNQIMRNWPLLEDLGIGGIVFTSEILNRFWCRLPNLVRIHFHNIEFNYCFDSPEPEKLSIQWIKFDECTKDWNKVADYLIKASPVKTVVISLKDKSNLDEVQKVYDLTPLIDSKNASLELTINSIKQPRDLEGLLVPTELSRILTKLELHSVHHSRLLQSIFISDQFEKLREMKLRNCIELGDRDLAIVAELCLNLEKISFKPHQSIGLHAITDQCLKTFIIFWNSRKSMQFSIECLRTDLAFGWFPGPPDQEKGVFEDGKRWMLFRNSVLSGKVGTRMVIWDQNGKKMVIRDYEKDSRKKLEISVEKGSCRVKEVINP